MRRLLVTGGAGFIGSNFIKHMLAAHPAYEIINLDKLTYAGNPDNLRAVEANPRYRFVRGDICDSSLVAALTAEVDAVVNFAAETHVDRSLIDAGSFIQTDVYGTFVLLQAASTSGVERMLQVSTDEVYGDIPSGQSSPEMAPLRPRSPYAASKAGADMLCQAFFTSYHTPVLIARGSNNLGPHQYPEKAIPLFITNALEDKPLPIYGDGRQARDWIYVGDFCQALDLILHRGAVGEVYNVGASNERENLAVAHAILNLLGKSEELIQHVEDRKGHDRRYSMDCAKVSTLGWRPSHDFPQALAKTVQWYVDNPWWWQKIKSGTYAAYYQQQYGMRQPCLPGEVATQVQ